MNPPPNREDLLDDVLSEAAPPDFRAALLGETLQLARGRRHRRQARRVGAVLALAGLVAVVVWRNRPPPAEEANPPVAACEIIHTQPLPADAIIHTRPFGAELLVASLASIDVVHTAVADGILRLVNDDELLALAAPQPAALVRVGPHEQELIFVKPAEETDSR